MIHGSSSSSGATIHALSEAMAHRGVEVWAIDIRGHGASGTRGDIAYVGQLEDDLADFVALVRKTEPNLPFTLIGHSAGGGFALRVAGAAVTKPLTPFSGADDELMLADKYADAVHAIAPAVDVKLIPGVHHMGIVSDPKAIAAIANDVAKTGAGP